MLTLQEICNKYLTIDRIEKDPIIEEELDRVDDWILEERSGVRSYILDKLKSEFKDPILNSRGRRKLWKPGIPTIPIDRGDLNMEEYYDYFLGFKTDELIPGLTSSNFSKLVLSEILENVSTTEPYYKIIYSTSKTEEYERHYISYLEAQKLFIYYLPSYNIFNTKPNIQEVYKEGKYKGEFRDIKGNRISFLGNYFMAFSEGMLKEQFKTLKETGLRNMAKRIASLEDSIESQTKRLKDLEYKRDELLDKYSYEEERLDELFKL